MEGWPSGRRRLSRKQLRAVIPSSGGSNPSPSADGRVAEWTKASVLKTEGPREGARGFESLLFRQMKTEPWWVCKNCNTPVAKKGKKGVVAKLGEHRLTCENLPELAMFRIEQVPQGGHGV